MRTERTHAWPTISAAEVRTLLLDSWVTDGRRGFFVDGAHSTANPPFSLYDTLWQLRLCQRCGQGTAGLSPASVQAWIGGALDGRMDSSGLPAIAQVEYAAQTLDLVGAPVDRQRVARTLDRLRRGGGYCTSVSAAQPDWGSTALAVRIQVQLGLPVPSQVVADAAQSLNSHAVAPASLAQVISLLQIAGELGTQLGGAVPAQTLAGLVHAADRTLSGARVDAAWLALNASLRRAAAQLAVTIAPVSPGSCTQLVDRDGSVTLPGQPAPDPQATFYSLELGCRGVRTPPLSAHSRAGWPNHNAVAGSVGASAAAMRVAREVRLDCLFANALQHQTREVWLPAMQHEASPRTVGTQIDQVNLRILAALIGEHLARDVDNALPAPAISESGEGTNDVAMLLDLINLAQSSPSPQRLTDAKAIVTAAVEGRGALPSLVCAAWLEVASQIFSDPNLHERAVAEARHLRIAPGLYAASRSTTAGAPDASEASLTASTIGTWIERPTTDVVRRWAEAGLCTEDRCAETAKDLERLDSMPMATLATVLASQRRAYGEIFPIAF